MVKPRVLIRKNLFSLDNPGHPTSDVELVKMGNAIQRILAIENVTWMVSYIYSGYWLIIYNF